MRALASLLCSCALWHLRSCCADVAWDSADVGTVVVVRTTKHVRLRYHFLKDLVANNEIKMAYTPSNEMVADILTKILDKQATTKHRLSIMGESE